MMKKQIATGRAPKAVGPYSQAVSTGGFLFVSGQIPLDPETGKIVEGAIEEQADRVFQNIRAILNEAGLGFPDVVSATVYLADIGDFAAVNEVYARYFSEGVLPARSAVQIGALPKQASIEISCVAQEKG
ncbi:MULTISPECIES: RidA family protein [unclassified Sporolactobacillus]|uniref:RidA family protein n=1 Tax=unclassified Sporolactobacillus TaxID=2628533 RepID=UPI0023689A5F|nr:RidA family protein [Sporolactobacillus sp. CQH2019]MDD9147904.1 RidA family protein [Sporolactobacillus sp. CQH2019]